MVQCSLNGVVIGLLVGFDDERTPLLAFPGKLVLSEGTFDCVLEDLSLDELNDHPKLVGIHSLIHSSLIVLISLVFFSSRIRGLIFKTSLISEISADNVSFASPIRA